MTNASVENFLNKIVDETRRDDCYAVLNLMKRITKADPKMWGSSIVGFGSYRYTYASGQEGDWPLATFSPRKQNLVLYLMISFDKCADQMKKLGKYKTKACLYIKKLSDIDTNTLTQLLKISFQDIKNRYN